MDNATTDSTTVARTRVIGAGLAGLTAASHLVSGGLPGRDVSVVDEASGVGGRLATAHLEGATIDHGAQFFTVRSDEFRSAVDAWVAAGVAEVWCRGFSEIDGYPRYRVRGGMNELARHLAAELEADGVSVETAARVEAVAEAEADGHWSVRTGDGTARPADALVLTPPVPLSLGLLDRGGATLDGAARRTLDGFDYHRVIALLTVLDRSPDLPPPGALQQPADPTFTFVADNQAKGISTAPAVTFHTAHARSAELWDASDDDILAALLPAAEAIVKPARIVHHHIERWRFAGPIEAHRERCLLVASRPGPVVLAGDGFGGSKVEGAFLSGRAAAETVVSELGLS